MTTPRLVIDLVDNEVRTITADRPVEVVLVHTSEEVLENLVSNAVAGDPMPVIPCDLAQEDPSEASVFEIFKAEVDKESVEETYNYVQDEHRQSIYSRLVLNFYKKLEAEEEEEDDDGPENDSGPDDDE